jgi:very-short-patch-repair endonuclease
VVWKTSQSIWHLAAEQHGVVTRTQLLDHGLSSRAIEHRIARGRLHRIRHGVYAVGRPRLNRHGVWMAAVLSCGDGAALSHDTAGALLGIRPDSGRIEISTRTDRRRPGIVVHRRAKLEITHQQGIPVTPPVLTLVDLATRLPRDELEAAINAADRHDLTDPEALRAALDGVTPRPGLRILRETLDRRTFRLTDSALERRFLQIARRAGLSLPKTGQIVNGYKVDFYWPDLGLVVETDGLRYHRTPAQQVKDRLRDQAHAASGLTHLRFTHAQLRYERGQVQETLGATTLRLLRAPDSWQTPRAP